MFKSLTYKDYDRKTNQFLCELEDSEFGIVEIGFAGGGSARGVIGVAREYSKRGLDVAEHSYAKVSDAYRQGLYAYVGKNLAVYAMWHCEIYRYAIEDICKVQDEYCPEHIPNWKEYATSRDEYLAKLLLIGY